MPPRTTDVEPDRRGTAQAAQDRRFGRLRPVSAIGVRGDVRCACDRCGAHVLATPTGTGYRGICMVCGSEEVTPV